MGKWSWCFAKERWALWHSVINARYGVKEGGWCSCIARGAYGVGVWKAIKMDRNVVGSKVAFVVGNGRRVRFWLDRWCGDEQLRDAFPCYMHWLLQRRRGCQIFGAAPLRKDVGSLVWVEVLMIGR